MKKLKYRLLIILFCYKNKAILNTWLPLKSQENFLTLCYPCLYTYVYEVY